MCNKGTNMTLDEFKRIIGPIPKLFGKKIIAINFSGIGENLMNPDFMNMLELCKNAIYVTFTDNFTMLDKKTAKKIINAKVNSLFVSLDGATKKTYEKLRVGAKFEDVIKKIKDFVELKKASKTNKPELIIRFVPTKDNIHELPKIIELAKQIGISSVNIPRFYVSKDNKHLKVDNKTLNEYKKEALKIAKKLDIRLDFRNQRSKPIKQCFRAKNSMFITAKGYVLPCCFLNQFGDYEKITKKFSFGNINKKTLKQIWNSHQYIKFRKHISKGKKPEVCQNCQLFY